MPNTAQQLRQKKEFLKPWMIDICLQCRKRKTCKSICRPCEIFINKNGRPQLEKDVDDKHTRLFHRTNEIPFSNFGPEQDRFSSSDYLNNCLLQDEKTTAEFEEEPTCGSTQSKIIFQRLVKGESFSDIATRFGMKSAEAAAQAYTGARLRLIQKLEALSKREKVIGHADNLIKKRRERIGEIPKAHKYWVLCCIMGLTPKEISVMEGHDPDDREAIKGVATTIGKISRKLLDGDLVFLNPHKVKNQKEIRNKQLDQIRQAMGWLMKAGEEDPPGT